MKVIFKAILIALIADSLIRCANPVTPTGGPKDTIPPLLITSIPEHKSLNFEAQQVTLTFDEHIAADKIKANLIITPSLTGKYTHTIRKDRLLIKFEEPLEDSTTYTLNFFDGLTDITEKNPSENLILAFSTGPYIDSLYVTGSVKNLYNQKPSSKFIVGFYPFTDTLDFTLEKPRYFVRTSEEGIFRIENMKDGLYKILCFNDENSNLLFNPDQEEHGFLADTINLTSSLDSLRIKTNLIDAATFKFISARPSGKYFEARYNKQIVDHDIEPLDPSDGIFATSIEGEGQSIRFYNNLIIDLSDSLGQIIKARDTLQSELADTVFVKFIETQRRPKEMEITSSFPKTASNQFSFQLLFSKPITAFFYDSIYFTADSIFNLPLDTSTLQTWNHNFTQLNIETSFDWTYYNDTLNTLLENLYNQRDSVDTAANPYQPRTFIKADLEIKGGAFISVENDTSAALSTSIQKFDPENFGVIKISNIITDKTSYTVQLIDKNFNVLNSFQNQTNYTFTKVPPGSYSFRVLIDDDNDGQWTFGNINNNIQPESVFIYPTYSDIRANWELIIEDLTF
ncbi:MAG: Ig-like domain-containing protein [Cyclobacteriaceae bacterium]|nr:Ig-like domain-containing protein [Cyclobacteriaceae bacterium HetDA_MAG_MS6]